MGAEPPKKYGEVRRLEGWENEAYLWIEAESSIMVKVVSKFGDPVELTSTDARRLADLLMDLAERLDR